MQTCSPYELYRSDGFLMETNQCNSSINSSEWGADCGRVTQTRYNPDGSRTVETVSCNGQKSYTVRDSYNTQIYCQGDRIYGSQASVKTTYDANNNVVSTRKVECYAVSNGSLLSGCSEYGYVAGNGTTTGKWRIVTTENGKTVTQNCDNGIDRQTMECRS